MSHHSLAGQVGAHRLFSRMTTDQLRQHTEPARTESAARLRQRLIDKLYPDGVPADLDPEELERQLDHARSEYFAQLKLDGLRKARQERAAAEYQALAEAESA